MVTQTTVLQPSWTLSGTTRVSRHQKGKTNLDVLEQEIVSSSGISWAISKPAPWPKCRHITTPASHHSVFTGRKPFLPLSPSHPLPFNLWVEDDMHYQWRCKGNGERAWRQCRQNSYFRINGEWRIHILDTFRRSCVEVIAVCIEITAVSTEHVAMWFHHHPEELHVQITETSNHICWT